MKFSFLDYTQEIWAVSKAQKVEADDAFRMFEQDVKNGRPSNTGDALPSFDFKGTKAEWDKLTLDEQKAVYEEWNDFFLSEYNAICKAYPAGPEAIKAVVEAWHQNEATE